MNIIKIFQKLERNLWFIFYFPKKQIFLRLTYLLKRYLQEKRNKYLQNKPEFLKKRDFCEWDFLSIPKDKIISRFSSKKNLPITLNLVGYKYKLNLLNNWDFKNGSKPSLLQKMYLHYMEYLRDLNEYEGSKVIIDWISKVKPYSEKYWSYSWNSYSLSIRVVNWVDFLTVNSKNICKKDLQIIKKSISDQVRFLFHNLELDIRGNHLIKNIRCLFRVSSLQINKESKKWLLKASYLLDKELDHQIMNDGMHFELSHAYHIQIFEDLLCIRRSLTYINNLKICAIENNKLLIKIEQKLKKMIFPLYVMTHPDGKASLLGDGGMNMNVIPERMLFKTIKDLKLGNHLELPKEISWRLSNSGYCGYKSEKSTFIIDCGPTCANDLPAHGQGDSLSFEWSLNKTRFIVDTGVFEYKPGVKRSYSRSTAAHNTITIDNQDQSQLWSSFRTGRRANTSIKYWKNFENGFSLEAYHDGYKGLKGKPIVLRKLDFQNDHLIVNDEVLKGNISQVIKSRILFAPFVKIKKKFINKERNYCCLLILFDKESTNKSIELLFESDTCFLVRPALWFPDFGVSLKTSKIIINIDSDFRKANWSIRVLKE